jgi:nitrate reductase NapE component
VKSLKNWDLKPLHQTEQIAAKTLSDERERSNELRSFGLLVGAAFLAIGLWPMLSQSGTRIWAMLLATVLILPALVQPSWLKVPHAIWMKIGAALGWFNTRLILGILYVVAVVPVALLLRVTGKTPLQLKFDKTAASYREKPDSDDDQNITQQY